MRVFLVHIGLLLSFFSAASLPAAEPTETPNWTRLFNGTNLNGWYTVVRNARSDDPNHFVQIEDGMIHMYKDAPADSPQPAGYIATEKEFSNYRLRLEYKWGVKKFAPRTNAPRDAGILYHVTGKDGVWPRSVECQIQENDVGDIWTVNTRIQASVDPKTTNIVMLVKTNAAGAVQTNRSAAVFLEPEQGGVPFVEGIASSIRRIIRNPMHEHEGWNTVEVVVHGDEATYIVNGKVNNRATHIQQMVNGEYAPLRKGKIALQFEFAEVYYRNVEIEELKGE